MNKQSELILNKDGSIYHLNLLPGDLAEKIILVGDPGRVDRVIKHFEEVRIQKHKREFVTATGSYKGVPMSVVSTGIGPDNIDIVFNEIDALFNINMETRMIRPNPKSLKMLRLGTCGGLQKAHPVGSLVSSRYAIGSDTVSSFYHITETPKLAAFKQAFLQYQQAKPVLNFPFYQGEGSEQLSSHLSGKFPQIQQGITFTAGGFYGPQGRDLGRLKPTLPDLPDYLSDFRFEDHSILNIEMETSAIFSLGGSLGHQCGSISVILANRPAGTFAESPGHLVNDLIRTGLEVMRTW